MHCFSHGVQSFKYSFRNLLTILPFFPFRIPHYEQRLRSLHYKKRFNVWVNEIEPRVRAVMEASREVSRSRRLRRLLELVLALGNYMNRGARGNATGFRLASLNRLADTKSSACKGTTLLHYLVEILEKKVSLNIDKLYDNLCIFRKVNYWVIKVDIKLFIKILKLATKL